ncbi:MAG: amylo-alpha-1,6-glucosidase, partial [Candidatus Limnocylindrales bacterium]
VAPTSHETTNDRGKATAAQFPGRLSDTTVTESSDPIGILHFSRRIEPGGSASYALLISFSSAGRAAAGRTYRSCPPAAAALARTQAHYAEVLGRAVVVTPDPDVNRGVFWAKANMLRTELRGQTGWAVVNDPTRSNNSVARDTAWFAFGSDYITPEFSRRSLLWYARHLESNGMVVEFYDIRTGRTADYKLNINDDTPLLILALWHHYHTSGDGAFLEEVYPFARAAALYILSQRNERGLVWCSATGTADWGIVGWRNVIANYTLSGASTELNSECYAALRAVSGMARKLAAHDDATTFGAEADHLRASINEHLLNPATGLYYLTIDPDGQPRTEVTADLVFPVMFGVADHGTAARIIGRLSRPEFWTEHGIRTVPRDAIDYGPVHGYGLLGGVWVAKTFWFAFAAARFNPRFMAAALSSSFRYYSIDPLRNNTVPGQFSEWLHGESLTNQGMMLSPWFPPRYLWAAIEGAGGLDLSGPEPSVHPRLAPEWQWLGVRNLPLRGRSVAWFVVRAPDLQMYATGYLAQGIPCEAYEREVTARVEVGDEVATAIALRRDGQLVILVGNTAGRTITTTVRFTAPLEGSYARRSFSSLRGEWLEWDGLDPDELARGLPVELDSQGFCVIELRQTA